MKVPEHRKACVWCGVLVPVDRLVRVKVKKGDTRLACPFCAKKHGGSEVTRA